MKDEQDNSFIVKLIILYVPNTFKEQLIQKISFMEHQKKKAWHPDSL